ncbi:hypothetical protein [Francisella orientalis]|uniref:hypothetical protein n=1 Tax=Francisella orientalis TaxID=299583 RepID=UPI001580B884|nr:hypothetical protein [Francisella orientalis]MBK2047849.1 hypothetical protein [Francisella orientalis]MBK2074202.1 hypothetical protein [Francisella orientalis]MBK2091743.1 hypothetical protein [Francisella orientalis]
MQKRLILTKTGYSSITVILSTMMAIPARSIPTIVISFQVMLGSFFKISNLSINIKTIIKPRYFIESKFRPI